MAEADVINSLTEINQTLRRNVAVNIRTYRNVIGLRKDMKPSARDIATEGLDEEKKPIREANQQSTDRGKVAKEAKKGFFSSFLKWFGLLGLGVFLKDQIGGFISGAFGQLKKYISAWWEKTGEPAFSKFSDSIGLTKLMNYVSDIGTKLKDFALSIPGVKALGEFLFGKDAVLDDKGNILVEGKEGLFGPIVKYARNFKDALIMLGKDLGLLNEDGSISTMGMITGVGVLATLFTFIGPLKLATLTAAIGIAGVKTLGGLFVFLAKKLGTLAWYLGKNMLLDPLIWVGKKGLQTTLGLASKAMFAASGKFENLGFKRLSNAMLSMATGAEGFATRLKGDGVKGPDAKAGKGKGLLSRIGGFLKTGLRTAGGLLMGPLVSGTIAALPLILGAGVTAAAIGGLILLAKSRREKLDKQDKTSGEKNPNVSSKAAAQQPVTLAIQQDPEFEDYDTKDKTTKQLESEIKARVAAGKEDEQKANQLIKKLEDETSRIGGKAKRLLYLSQLKALPMLNDLNSMGLLKSVDGSKMIGPALKAMREDIVKRGPDNVQLVDEQYLKKFGLTIVDKKIKEGDVLKGGFKGEGMMKMLGEARAGTFDFKSKLGETGGLTGFMQSYGRGEELRTKAKHDPRLRDQADFTVNQKTLAAAIQAFVDLQKQNRANDRAGAGSGDINIGAINGGQSSVAPAQSSGGSQNVTAVLKTKLTQDAAGKVIMFDLP